MNSENVSQRYHLPLQRWKPVFSALELFLGEDKF
ncbi:hypothetical protein T11_10135 [Trichinella zimbabwensis]|uniref:Uncharacterized protein n=1 Tax=Trichinella zimbabwensis TaxID=268475 RepID=A0A0V1GH15_9BILA|nr:hypothetical protein T11_10135 [Trichinella zimbabwensis]